MEQDITDTQIGKQIINTIKSKRDANITQQNFDFEQFMKIFANYILTNNTTIVPADYVDTSQNIPYPLGDVVKRLVTLPSDDKTKIVLGYEQQKELYQIGFNANKRGVFEENDFLDHIKQHVGKNKYKYLPADYIDPTGYPLGRKMQMVKNGYFIKQQKLPKDTPHLDVSEHVYEELLNMHLLRTERTTKEQRNFNFEQFITHYRAYCQEQAQNKNDGPYYVPQLYDSPDGYLLAHFFRRIKDMIISDQNPKNQKPSKYRLTEEQLQTVLSVGHYDSLDSFVAPIHRKHPKFDKFCERLIQYNEQYDTTYVPVLYVCEDGYQLGKQAESYRINKKQNRLSKEAIEKLDSLNFYWNFVDYAVDEFCIHYVEYYAENDGKIPTRNTVCSDGYHLGVHMNHLQKLQKCLQIGIASQKMLLEERHIQQLNNTCPGWNNKPRTIDRKYEYYKDFDTFYDKLLEYKNKYGNLNVPANHRCKDNYPLYYCINYYRHRKNHACVSKEQQAKVDAENKKLDEIGFVWNGRVKKSNKSAKSKDEPTKPEYKPFEAEISKH